MMDPALVAALDQLQATVAMNAKTLKVIFDQYTAAGFSDEQATVFTQSMLDYALQGRLMGDDDETL